MVLNVELSPCRTNVCAPVRCIALYRIAQKLGRVLAFPIVLVVTSSRRCESSPATRLGLLYIYIFFLFFTILNTNINLFPL